MLWQNQAPSRNPREANREVEMPVERVGGGIPVLAAANPGTLARRVGALMCPFTPVNASTGKPGAYLVLSKYGALPLYLLLGGVVALVAPYLPPSN